MTNVIWLRVCAACRETNWRQLAYRLVAARSRQA
jgi:hypothetical protein